MSQANVDVVRNFLDGAWNRHDLSAIDQTISEEHYAHQPLEDQFPQGREGMHIFVSTFLGGMPDTQVSIGTPSAEGDMVRTMLTFTGTQTGDLMGIPPTGRPVEVNVDSTFRIENGMIAESWYDWNPQELMQQLGVE